MTTLTRRAALSGAVATVATVGAVVPSAPAMIADGPAATLSTDSIFATRLAEWRAVFADGERVFAKEGLQDAEANACLRRGNACLAALLDTPSPDLRGIAAKLDAIATWTQDAETPSEYIVDLAADARRLAKMEG